MTMACAAIEGHSDVSVLGCQPRLWACPGLGCHWGSVAISMSVVFLESGTKTEDVCGLGYCLNPCWCPSAMLIWMQESKPCFSLNCSPICDLGMDKVVQCLMLCMQKNLPCPSQGQQERAGLNVWMQENWFCPQWGRREARQRPGLTNSAATQSQN